MTFQIGDRVEIVAGQLPSGVIRSRHLQQYLGRRGTVATELRAYKHCGPLPIYHEVRFAEGDSVVVVPEDLRLIPPDREDLVLVAWAHCPWQPREKNRALEARNAAAR